MFAPRSGMEAGKGDFPRNLGPQFEENYPKIKWDSPKCVECGKVWCDHIAAQS